MPARYQGARPAGHDSLSVAKKTGAPGWVRLTVAILLIAELNGAELFDS
jgi:hypothetical protein